MAALAACVFPVVRVINLICDFCDTFSLAKFHCRAAASLRIAFHDGDVRVIDESESGP